ncbi:type II secretion system F family protein [Lentzea aerocolonigenes]|uniref:type II secretion system F family protein n=1 Tax=Lentzea aerocolonigenes TaxID=68170 RepID=UPI00068D06F9|nr:type II secretion system F family protein [Lentzea aerocolonigenes]MCP2243581.1 tight adherence protein B [Lentzea aerocolonigenes]
MILRLIAAVMVLCGASTLPAGADPTAELGSAKVEDGRMHVTLTARDVPDSLDPDGVRVEVDGTPVPATAAVVSEPRPARAALVVLDTTGTMNGVPIATAGNVVTAYLSALPADVHTGLVTFSDRPALTVPVTADRQQVTAALAGVGAAGSSALNDAVTLAARSLAGVPGTRRLLVLSDGEDADGGASLDATLKVLSETGVTVDVVELDGAAGAAIAGRNSLAQGSGGHLVAVGDARAGAALFAPAAPVRLEVSAVVPDQLSGRQVRLTVRVGHLVAETGVHAPDRRGADMPAVPAWTFGTLLGVIFTVLSGLGWLWFGRRRVVRRARRSRLAEVRRYRVRDGAEPETGAVREPTRPTRLLLALCERIIDGRGRRERIELDLDLAGVRLRPAEWLLVRFGIAVVLGMVLAAVTGAPMVCGPLGALLGWFGGRSFLKFRIGRRRTVFGEQLPDTLQLVAGALRSGFSLAQALDSTVREGTQPIAGEIARSLARTRLGVSVEDALQKAADRMRCQDLSWVVMAIRIQREVGGNLAELLLTTVNTMRERATVRRQIKALTAEGRMSAYVLISLPIGLGVWLFASRRDYIEPLYTRPAGWMMLGATAVCLCVGWFWMTKMIKVEV